MKKTLFIILLAFGIAVLPPLATAQEASDAAIVLQKARLDEEIDQLAEIYRGQLAEYRQAEKQFQIDKSQYHQLQTLASITAVTKSTQQVMKVRAQVLQTYFELLRVSLVATEGVELSLKEAVIQRLEAQKNWLQVHQQAVTAASEREEFNQLADTFSTRLDIFEETYQEANSLLFIGSLQDTYDRLSLLTIDMTEFVAQDTETKVNQQSFKETNLVITGLKTQFNNLWLELTASLEKKNIAGFYNGLGRDTETIYADLNKLISFLDELLREI